MLVVLYIIFSLVIIFGFVLLFGAPYLPTLAATKKNALDLLDLKPGQTLLELGSGDGRVAEEAARRGLKVVGYELNPVLVLVSLYVTRKYRQQIKIIWGNFFKAKWPTHDGIYVFLLSEYMPKLDKKIRSESPPGTLLASNSFKMSGKKPIKQLRSVYLYKY